MSRPPTTLDELSDSLNLWDKLYNGKSDIENQFQPLYDQFSIMEKYEVQIPEDIQDMLNALSDQWVSFQQTLIDADVMLKKSKVFKYFMNRNDVYMLGYTKIVNVFNVFKMPLKLWVGGLFSKTEYLSLKICCG